MRVSSLATALAVTLALCPALAHADRGALSLDLATGVTALSLRPPDASSGDSAWTVSVSLSAGLRYALSNHLELTLGGFADLPAHARHPSVRLPTVDSGTFTGALEYDVSRFGALAGIRWVTGLVVRLWAGAEVGWSHLTRSGLQLRDTTRPGAPDFGLPLPDLSTDSLVLQPGLGLEWTFADHWSASLGVRVTALLGPELDLGLSAMLGIAYVWFP